MVGYKHYVPVLRWKRAEWTALGDLRPAEKARITPLVEITPRSIEPRKKQPTLAAMLAKNAADMQKHWGSRPLFVDLWLLDADLRLAGGAHPLTFLAQEARRLGVALIPITGLRRDREYQDAVGGIVARDNRGLGLRLFRDDFPSGAPQVEIQRLIAKLGTVPRETDLLLDFQITDQQCTSSFRLCSGLPSLRDWRTLTVLSGAFPRDLSKLKVGQHFLPRSDWRGWRSQLDANPSFHRIPAYGDYAIQHPIYSEPPERANFSASIRYTLEKDWLVMRGEGVFTDGSPGFPQWPANAQLLCDRIEFCGRNFSAGDAYIQERSENPNRTGSAETWLRAGLNHHMTLVARGVASLGEP